MPKCKDLLFDLLHFFSRESADVFIWGLAALSASLGVGEKVKG